MAKAILLWSRPSIFLVVLLLVACGKPAKLTLLPSDATIIAFGDSLTVGVGTTREFNYPAMLEKKLGLNVINAGVSGEVTADGKKRLAALLRVKKPELLIICHGGNDFLHRFALAETEKNLRAMVKHAQSLGVEVVLISVPQLGIMGRAPALYKSVASEFNVPLENKILGKLELDPTMKSDPIHLNKQGYGKLADAVANLLVEAGAVTQ